MIVSFVLEKSSTAVITLLDQVNSKKTHMKHFIGN